MKAIFAHKPTYLLRILPLFLLLSLFTLTVAGQNPVDSSNIQPIDSLRDSLQQPQLLPKDTIDTVSNITYSDSISRKPIQSLVPWTIDSSNSWITQILLRHPYFHFSGKPLSLNATLKQFHGKETMFYVLIAIVLLFALLKLAFTKYVNDLFRVFFRTTLKQRQIREQLMQTPLPSLAFNFFFVASAGLYIDFMLHYFNILPVKNFWLLYLYCCIGLSLIYLVKFIGLKIVGWLFNMKSAADSYIFIVFIINKVIGIFLFPFLIFLGLTEDPLFSVMLVISWAGIAALLLYRFVLGFTAVRNEVRFNLFHFFLYLCAFEVAPLILIYRLLLLVF